MWDIVEFPTAEVPFLHPSGTLTLSHLSWDASHEPDASKGVRNARILELENLVFDYY